MLPLLLLFSLFLPSNGQFAEIASLATSLLGGGLGGAGAAAGAAGSAGSALGQIGQLYQLAQGALQLTGTGVGVLNQASEGNWFPAAIEAASKVRPMGGGLPGLGGLGPLGGMSRGGTGGIGPEFGTAIPAPDIDDYKDPDPIETATPKTPGELVGIGEKEDYDLDRTEAPSTTTESVTLFPDELESNVVIDKVVEVTTTTTTTASTAPPPPRKQIRIELPASKRSTDSEPSVDYIDQVTKEGAEVQITNKIKHDDDLNLLAPVRNVGVETKQKGGVPDLSKLIQALRKSNLGEEEIKEIVMQVEGNEHVVPPPKIDFESAVQNIGEKKAMNRERIVKASRELNANIPQAKAFATQVSAFPAPDSNLPAPPSPLSPFGGTVSPNPLLPHHPFAVPAPGLPGHPFPGVETNRLQREIGEATGDKNALPSTTSFTPLTPEQHQKQFAAHQQQLAQQWNQHQLQHAQIMKQWQDHFNQQQQLFQQQHRQYFPYQQQPQQYLQPQQQQQVQQPQATPLAQARPLAQAQAAPQVQAQQYRPAAPASQYQQYYYNTQQQQLPAQQQQQQQQQYNQYYQYYQQPYGNQQYNTQYNQQYYQQQQQGQYYQRQYYGQQPQQQQQQQQQQQYRPQQQLQQPQQPQQVQQQTRTIQQLNAPVPLAAAQTQVAAAVARSANTQHVQQPIVNSQHSVATVQGVTTGLSNVKARAVGYSSQPNIVQGQQFYRALRESSVRTTQPPIAHAAPTATRTPSRLYPARTARTLPLTTPSPVRGGH